MEDDSAMYFYIGQIAIFILLIFLMYRQNIRNFAQGQQEGLAIYRIIITMYHFLIILNVMQDAEYQRGAYKILKSFMD